MTRSRALSRQACALLAAMAGPRQGWRHGYELTQATGLKSGTLYPLLMRLEAQGHLEAQWQAPTAPGRPPRHAYRLTASGHALARSVEAEWGGKAGRRGTKRREAFS